MTLRHCFMHWSCRAAWCCAANLCTCVYLFVQICEQFSSYSVMIQWLIYKYHIYLECKKSNNLYYFMAQPPLLIKMYFKVIWGKKRPNRSLKYHNKGQKCALCRRCVDCWWNGQLFTQRTYRPDQGSRLVHDSLDPQLLSTWGKKHTKKRKKHLIRLWLNHSWLNSVCSLYYLSKMTQKTWIFSFVFFV